MIIAFVFATLIVQDLLYLYPKFQDCSFLLRMYRPVCVRPGDTPEDHAVFSHCGSNVIESEAILFAERNFMNK